MGRLENDLHDTQTLRKGPLMRRGQIIETEVATVSVRAVVRGMHGDNTATIEPVCGPWMGKRLRLPIDTLMIVTHAAVERAFAVDQQRYPRQ